MVHHTSHGSADGVYGKACRAATITAVDESTGRVDLLVVNPTSIHFPYRIDGEHIDDKIDLAHPAAPAVRGTGRSVSDYQCRRSRRRTRVISGS